MRLESVLITGAGGFIGSHLAEDQLRRNRSVKALDVNLRNLAPLRGKSICQLIEGDIRDEALLERIVPGTDIIFHLASAHLELNKPESYYWQTNVQSIRGLMKASHRHGVRRFVHCSSVGVYGPLAELPANEQTPCRPEILYEKTKLAGEAELRKSYGDFPVPYVILRPAWVYGPRCRRTHKLFRAIKKGRFLVVGTGDNLRHPVYVGDMLEAFELAATQEAVTGETFVIASSEAVRLKDIIGEIARIQGVRIPMVRIPLAAMKPVAAVVEAVFKALGKEPPFSRRSLKFFIESSSFDINKARGLLGFHPKVDLKKGLAETLEGFREMGLI